MSFQNDHRNGNGDAVIMDKCSTNGSTMINTTNNGLEQANDLVQSIFNQITMGDAPPSNFDRNEAVQLILAKCNNLSTNAVGTTSVSGAVQKSKQLQQSMLDSLTCHRIPLKNSDTVALHCLSASANESDTTNDNVSTTASEHSVSSSAGGLSGPASSSFASSKASVTGKFPPRPPSILKKEEDNSYNFIGATLMGTCALANLCSRTIESVVGAKNCSIGLRTPVNPSLLQLPPLTDLKLEENLRKDQECRVFLENKHQQQLLMKQQQPQRKEEYQPATRLPDEQDPTTRRQNGSCEPNSLSTCLVDSSATAKDQGNNDNGNDHDSSVGNTYRSLCLHEHEKNNPQADSAMRGFHEQQQLLVEKSTSKPNDDETQAEIQKPRIKMFGSEYARLLSSFKPTNTNNSWSRKSSNAVSSKIKAKLSSSMSVATNYSFSNGQNLQHQKSNVKDISESNNGGGAILNLDDCPHAISSAAITDVIITSGSVVPPRGYYRAFLFGEQSTSSMAKNVVPGTKKRHRLSLNVKKEPNWDRAVQRPCVTALCVIYPDRNEFVPPGFSVVRHYQPNMGKSSAEMNMPRFKEGEGGSTHISSSTSSANINLSASGERVYLCYRRSREGNPITGIMCLRPTKGDVIPEGYTVLERTPRNYLADISATSGCPLFLAYRQRLENLECLRPLPLVLAVMNSKTDGVKKELKAYYCTGGTVVSSEVGKLHILDRTTHSLLSSSSAQSKLTLIQLSRRESGNSVPKWPSCTSSHSSHSQRPASQHSSALLFDSGKSEDFNSSGHLGHLEHDSKCDSGSTSSFETLIESTVTSNHSRSLSHESTTSYGTETSNKSSSTQSSANRKQQIYHRIFSHSDDKLQACFDALYFIPPIECARTAEFIETSSFLQTRIAVITPILTACYTSQGGSAFLAVEGLISLLNRTAFFEPDVEDEKEKNSPCGESNVRLTLLDLTVQVVCDVATSLARETYFRSCVDFVSDAVRYAGGKLNDRTIGFVLRFYLFVYYFGASIPSNGWPFNKEWNENKNGMIADFLLSDNLYLNDRKRQSLVGMYLPGGAPHAAAIALRELVSVILWRLSTDNFFHEKFSMQAPQHSTQHLGEVVINRSEIANYTQLALYQIHRSGGSELFWHDMIHSCGIGLFRQESASHPGMTNSNTIAFAILASFVKISSGKVRVLSNNSEPVPRDVASKLLSLELILSFIKTWYLSVKPDKANENAKCNRSAGSGPHDALDSATTMVYVIRRLVVPTLLSNTSAALEDCRVFRRVLRIISHFWKNPYYRRQMKIDLAILIEHFVLKLLCVGPQVNRTVSPFCSEGGEVPSSFDDMPSLLNQQQDVLDEMTVWFSLDPEEVLDLYLNYDINQDCSLPPPYCNLCKKICEALCNLAEQCGTVLGEHSRFTSINRVHSSPKHSVLTPLSDMAYQRVTAQLLREKSFIVITSIVNAMMRCASMTKNPSSPMKNSSYLKHDTEQEAVFVMSPQLSPSPDNRMIDENIFDYWHTSIERRKAPLQTMVHQQLFMNRESLSFDSQSSSIKNSRSEDSSKGTFSQHKKESLDVALDLISTKGLKKGLDYLIACHMLTPSPRDVSSFLRIHHSSIDPEIIGEYLGEGGIDGADKDYWNHIRFYYTRAISFVGMNIEQGLRHFLTGCGFRLPGEAQKIDRIVSTFSQCYWEDNAGDLQKCPFQDQDTVFLISFAIIMLNTDLHKASGPKGKAAKKMTKNEFIINLRHVYNAAEKFRDYLIAIYDSIESNPIMISNVPLPTSTNMQFEQGASFLPFRDEKNFATSVQSWVRGVKRAQELLGMLSVRQDEVVSVHDEVYNGSSLQDLTYQMFSSTWHYFHGIINTVIESAYLDLTGLDCCIHLLEYALCTASYLDMTLERSAFTKLLGRVNQFNELKFSGDESFPISKNDSHEDTASSAVQVDFERLDEVRHLSQKLHSSLFIDESKVETMKRVASRIRNGEILLNDSSRTFVREGNLIKRHHLAGRSSTYRFFLFSDVLVYAHKSAQDDYKVHEELPLHLMKIEDHESPASNSAKHCSFHIHHPNKSFLVVASSPAEKQCWVDDIRSSIKQEIKRKAHIEGARKATLYKE